MTRELQEMYVDFVRDALTEDAIEAAARLARHLDNNPLADRAWQAVIALKALRRPEMTERMDEERLASIGGNA